MPGVELFADYHTHTRHSHGKGTVLQNAQAAARAGLEVLAITDHGPANLFGIGVRDLTVFDRIREEIFVAQQKVPRVKLLLGVEANVISLDGELDIPLSMQPEFDIVLVGLHPLVRWRSVREGGGLLAQNVLGGWGHERARQIAREKNTRAIVNAVRNNAVHIVTHPGYRLSIDTRALAQACAETGCALEISASHQHTTVEYLRIAEEEGSRFCIGSDAHEPERVGDFARGIALVKKAGIRPELIVNARVQGNGSSLPKR